MGDIKDLERKLEAMAARAKHAKPANKLVGAFLLKSVRRNFREGGRPRKWKKSRRTESGHKTLINTRSLMTSITAKATDERTVVGTKERKAALLNYGSKGLPGGVVKPKRGEYLTIPVGLTKNEKRRGMTARSFENTFFRMINNNLFLIEKLENGEIRILFMLVKSVTIPERRFMLVQKRDIPVIQKIYGDWLLEPFN